MRKNWNFKAPGLKAINIFKTLKTTKQSVWILKTMGKRMSFLISGSCYRKLEVNFICVDTHYNLPVISNIFIHTRQFIPVL